MQRSDRDLSRRLIDNHLRRAIVPTHRSNGWRQADGILGVLRQHGIDDPAQKDVLAIAYSLKDEIVHV